MLEAVGSAYDTYRLHWEAYEITILRYSAFDEACSLCARIYACTLVFRALWSLALAHTDLFDPLLQHQH